MSLVVLLTALYSPNEKSHEFCEAIAGNVLTVIPCAVVVSETREEESVAKISSSYPRSRSLLLISRTCCSTPP